MLRRTSALLKLTRAMSRLTRAMSSPTSDLSASTTDLLGCSVAVLNREGGSPEKGGWGANLRDGDGGLFPDAELGEDFAWEVLGVEAADDACGHARGRGGGRWTQLGFSGV